MSGIPQELVQRLAQELLRQVRLEAAMDPPPAITLATETKRKPGRQLLRPLNMGSRKKYRGSSTCSCSASLSRQRMLRLAQPPTRPTRHHRRNRQSPQPA